MKRFIKSILGLFDLEIKRKKRRTFSSPYRNRQMIGGLERVKHLAMTFNTVVDVGAATGSWTLLASPKWPQASFLLFEPLTERKDELEALVKDRPDFYFVPYAAGRSDGNIEFSISDDLDGSGVASAIHSQQHIRSVNVTSISNQVKKLKLEGPYLIKLDTHGFEIPIVEGCLPILDQISLFIIECYGFQIADNSLLFWEMCQYMEGLGFRLYDIVDVMNRSTDGAFWQCDAFFIKNDNSIFQHKNFR